MAVCEEINDQMSTERENEILKILYDRRRITVKELSECLYASETSIRRDLARLEKQHMLKRIHGGARLEANAVSAFKIPYMIRSLENVSEKQSIAEKAAALVREANVVFLDASTSALALLPFLARKKDITVITDGVRILSEAINYPELRIISTGGALNRSTLSLFGDETFTSIRNYHANFCFFSCEGVHQNGAITDFNEEENLVRRAMMRRSNKSYLLCTSKKIGIMQSHHLCDIDEVEGILSADEPPEWFPKGSRKA